MKSPEAELDDDALLDLDAEEDVDDEDEEEEDEETDRPANFCFSLKLILLSSL
jgi:hypothetical protein